MLTALVVTGLGFVGGAGKADEYVSRSQDPKKPYPYTEEFVSFDGAKDEVVLSGTLTLPESMGPYPVVILIPGSGRIDRDETVYGHKPFLVLADYLTRHGIAVLRYDKRGCGDSSGNYETATSQDFSNDVLAAIEFLKSRKDISLIGLVGHSEGGVIAPLVATKSKDVAFIVLMAGTGVTGEEILYEQGALIQQINGETEEAIAQYRIFQESLIAILKSESEPKIAIEQIKLLMASLPKLDKSTQDILEARVARISLNIEWFRYFLIYDPTVALKRVRVPVLVLNGDRDIQVSSKQNLPEISKALTESQNQDVTIVELPQLNHFFQTCETGALSEYEKIEETISPSVLELITDWILQKIKLNVN